LWSFAILSRFGLLYQENSGNPAPKPSPKSKVTLATNKIVLEGSNGNLHALVSILYIYSNYSASPVFYALL
jgi:hypothetical protein